MFTYYDVLGVSPNANGLQIKRAYKARAKRVHPDVAHNDQALRKMKVLNRAYAVLANNQRRAEYDTSVISLEGSYNCSASVIKSTKNGYSWVTVSMLWLVAVVTLWFFTTSTTWAMATTLWSKLPLLKP